MTRGPHARLAGIVVALALLAAPGLAQTPTTAPAAGAAPASEPSGADAPATEAGGAPPPSEPADAPPAAASGQLDPDLVQRVIRVLEDETARQQVLETLRALAAVEQPPAPPSAAETLVARPLDWLRSEIDKRAEAVESSIEAVAGSTGKVEFFGSWLRNQLTSPTRRAFWLETLTQIGLVLGTGSAVGLSLRRALRRPRNGFEAYAPPTPLHFAGALALHTLTRLIPIAIFVAAAALVAWALNMGAYTLAVTSSLVQGLAFVTALTAVVRAVLNVRNPHMRLFPVEEMVGRRIQRGIVQVIAIGGYGYFALEAARALGLPWTLHGFFAHILFFITFLLYVRFVLRFRRLGAEGFRAIASETSSGLLGRFLPWGWVAGIWHVGAILFGLVIYLTWALEIAGGPAFLLRAVGISLALLFLTRLVNVWLTERAMRRVSTRPTEDSEEQDLTDVIATARQSPATFLLRAVTTVLALLLILQAWGADVLGWLASDAAEGVRSAATTIVIAITLAYGIWRAVDALMRGAMDETDALGRPVRSNRSRTLLEIGRNVAFITIWVTVTMLALSELGVNLAPLLAGAGVIGLAIGFGAQTLVQDIITGFFMLIEDTIAVGDVADLGGKAGVVEAISLRTVRLRAYDGQVHTIPFSKISMISNLTKDFSYYVFNIGVAYKEDVDRVMSVMAEVGEELARDRAFRRLIVAPLEIAGVDAFADSAVIIKARVKTRPLQQWTVGREYNRRLKNRFDQLGIEIPFPQRTLHFPAGAPAATPGAGAAAGQQDESARQGA